MCDKNHLSNSETSFAMISYSYKNWNNIVAINQYTGLYGYQLAVELQSYGYLFYGHDNDE